MDGLYWGLDLNRRYCTRHGNSPHAGRLSFVMSVFPKGRREQNKMIQVPKKKEGTI